MRALLLSIFIFCFFNGLSQIQVGSFPTASPTATYGKYKVGRLSNKYIERLKKTTTLFVLQRKDTGKLAEWQEAIQFAWKICPYKIIGDKEIKDYVKKPGYSFFSFSGTYETSSTSYGDYYTALLAYDLWIPEDVEDAEIKKEYYARIYLDATNDTWEEIWSEPKKVNEPVYPPLFTRARYILWQPGIMKVYWKVVNDMLTEQWSHVSFTDESDYKALAKLQKDTLYIPDYVYHVINGPGRKTKFAEDEDNFDNNLQQYYKYPVKQVTLAELEGLIADKKHLMHYLTFSTYNLVCIVSVYRSDGVLIYNHRLDNKTSPALENKDLKALARDVR